MLLPIGPPAASGHVPLGTVPRVSRANEPRGGAGPALDEPSGQPGAAVPRQETGSPVPPPAPTGAAGLSFDRLWRRAREISAPGRYVAVLAVLSATVAVVLRHNLFPYLSINNDEVIYLTQARAMAGGHLFPAAPDPAASYAPWLAAVSDGHYVLKYTPFVPGLFALGLLLTGSISPVLALVAAAAVVVTYLFGVELSGDRRVAALAATLLAFSPLMIVQSALVLSYLPVLVLLELTLLGLLRGLRGRGRRGGGVALAGAGLAAGVAVAVRPYDVVLVLAPVVIWAVVKVRRDARLGWALRWAAAGLALPAGLLLAFNAAATGSPFRLPFALLEPDDKLGFGWRRLYPSDGGHDFGLGDGLASVGDHLWLLGGWACGGVLLAVAAVVTVARRRLDAPGYLLGLGSVLFLIGYLGFWGAWNAAELWGGIRYVGPFYLMPVMIGLVHLGARGVVDLATWSRRRVARGLTGVGTAGVVSLTTFILVVAVDANATMTGHDRELAGMLRSLPDRSLVLVSATPAYLGHPSAVTANGPDLDGADGDGDLLFAVSRGVADLKVVADHPDRTPYLLRMPAAYNRSPQSPTRSRVDALTLATGRTVDVEVSVGAAPAGSRAAQLVFEAGGTRLSYPVPVTGQSAARLTVDADGLDADDVTDAVSYDGARTRGSPTGREAGSPLGRPRISTVPGAGTSITVSLLATPASGGRARTVDRQVLPVLVEEGADIAVLAPSAQIDEVGTGSTLPVRITLP
ncbi:hypothetical protein CcI49_07535 [Frankia sp. CcI49]|uniref:DUF7846 domain-containing protein n=1 Tax=Frankia sp. CcI49 TaxID=1745382 RepID=UPI000978C592|nr:glycosyltransferase family 39 protein [Frankia sp. CcI49]ONH61173.1 hypothetical protein CcI49_07535 [Frankia sp. CcI49]